jgi:hypothetical protein
MKFPESKPKTKLDAFESSEAFTNYAKERFDLTPDELRTLYRVMIKLQNMGQDPIEAMDQCQYEMEEVDCLEMLRFMIQVEGMDMRDLLQRDLYLQDEISMKYH